MHRGSVGDMYQVKRQTLLVIALAFALILTLSILYSRANPPLSLYISFVVVSLIVANLLALLAVRLHRLESEAITDPLTGAFNRRYFEKRLHQEIKRAERTERPLSILFLDIDGFKAYNDHHGHAVGDEVVKRVVEITLTCIREMDIVARYGGEEFVIVLPEVEIDAAASVSERIRESIYSRVVSPSRQEDHRIKVTVGVASLRQREIADSLLGRADQAMYQGKLRGKNQTCMDPDDAKGKILIVDDEPAIRDLCSRVLLKEGFFVDVAASGDAALQLLEQSSYNLLITDMRMPGASGLEVLKAMRALHPQTPAISISASADEQERTTIETLGNVEFLSKPFEPRDLVDRVIETTAHFHREEANTGRG